jgi:bacterioferritin-associated ferredoxin
MRPLDSPEPRLYACICHAVTTAEVDAAVALGATTVKQVRQATGAGASCGTCVKRLSCLLAAARVADSAPAEAMPEAERLPVEPVAAPAAVSESMPAPAPGSVPVPAAERLPFHAPHCPAAVALG